MIPRIVQIASAATSGKVRLFALDCYGNIWYIDTGSREWVAVVPVPDMSSFKREETQG